MVFNGNLSDTVDSEKVSCNREQPQNSNNVVYTPTKTENVVIDSANKDEEYDMTHPNRGVAILINHEEFEQDDPRHGSAIDLENMSDCLRHLQFDARIFQDLTKAELFDEVQKIAEEDHSQADCLLTVVMSHGNADTLMAKDVSYPVKELLGKFEGNACPTLVGKPKLFFVQACRGGDGDDGVSIPQKKTNSTVGDAVDAQGRNESTQIVRIPSKADMLVMYSTCEGHMAFRRPDEGSWFIMELYKELNKNGFEKELRLMLNAVSRNVAIKYESHMPNQPNQNAKKQMPCVVSTLTKSVFFPRKDE